MEKGGRKGEGGDRERSEGDWDRKKFGTIGGGVSGYYTAGNERPIMA